MKAPSEPAPGIDGQIAGTTDPDPGVQSTVRAVSRGRLVLRRFLRRRLSVAGLAVLVLLFGLAFLGPYLSPWERGQKDFTAFLQAPSARHWFGTTQIGNDLYALTLDGLQKSLVIGLLAAVLSTGLAAAVGACAGYFGGWVERVLMYLVDLLLVLPAFLILAIMSPAFRGETWLLFVVLLALFSWMITARVVRGLTLSLREREFIRAARFMGVPARRIIVRHLVPNMSSLLVIDATITVGGAILAETGLSYFGFGVQPPDISLGTLIADGSLAALTFPWLFAFPGGLLILTVLAVAVVGDGLRDALDPTAASTKVPVPRPPAVAAGAAPDGVRPAPSRQPVLDVADLSVTFPSEHGPVTAVRGLSYQVLPGEVLGIVGESGSGKTVSSLAVMSLLPRGAQVTGSVRLHGRELLGLGDRQLSAVRGNKIAMVFQDPLSALTPVYPVGAQIAEAIQAHQDVPRARAAERAIELLELVGIPSPADRARQFPHEYSGGMRQRAMIAMAIANDPDVIIADEPATALDVTIQAQILEVLKTAQRATGAAIVMITHDLGVLAGFADRIVVMYAGKPVESAPTDDLFYRPLMPYSLGLLGSIPRLDATGRQPLTPIEGTPPSLVNLPPGCPFAPRCPLVIDICRRIEPPLAPARPGDAHLAACHRSTDIERDELTGTDVFTAPLAGDAAVALPPRERRTAVLEVRNLVKHHPLTRGTVFRRTVGTVHAVDGISFDIREGETLALVGESGCGKTTTTIEILNLIRPVSGQIVVLGRDTARLTNAERRAIRGDVSVVFQDPMASLDPRMPIGDILAEPLTTCGVPAAARRARVRELLGLVGLNAEHANRYPREFSGGQRQRVAIARALALRPKLVVLDEPVSALDVSIQAGVINLLERLRARLGLAYLFVAHDLSVVRHIADRVAVMYLGRIVEIGEVRRVFEAPEHPYTQALLSAIPLPDPRRERARRRIVLAGDPPSPVDPPSGCTFRTRCPTFVGLSEERRRRCVAEQPPLLAEGDTDHEAACHYAQARQVV